MHPTKPVGCATTLADRIRAAAFIRVLAQLFPTRVRLQPPADSAAAARFAEQLQKDAASSGVTANHALLAGLASDRRCDTTPTALAMLPGTIPSGICLGHTNQRDWTCLTLKL